MRRPDSPAVSREGGFTVAELLVSLAVVVLVLLAVLMLIDFSTKLSRAQANVSDMQQSLRVSTQEVAAKIRMAGVGGLSAGVTAPGGIQVIQSAGTSQRIGGGSTPKVYPGSDILITRGVFSTPLFHVDAKLSTTFTLNNINPAAATAGTVVIRNLTPTLIPQSLTPLIDAVTKRRPEALILISPRDSRIFSVVELDPANSNVGDPANVTIAFFITGGNYTTQYKTFSPNGTYHPDLTRCAFVGIIEEHRYYIHENTSSTGVGPTLAEARTYPGVDVPWGADTTNWDMDLADNIIDLQVALGLDSTNGGGSMIQDSNDVGNDDRIFEAADGKDDDWLFNGSSDVVTDAIWTNARLHYVRIDLLARTDRRDPNYVAPLLGRIENRTYTTADTLNTSRDERMYRRRVLQTLINVRNF
jgi:hypothetical protein